VLPEITLRRQRLGIAAGGSRIAVPARILPAISQPCRLATGGLRDNDFHSLPIRLLPEVRVQVDLPHGPVAAQVCRLNVGRLKLFLLDTNTERNTAEDRKITYQLYGGDLEMRLKQEILLGIGGYRTLEAMGLVPTVYHMK